MTNNLIVAFEDIAYSDLLLDNAKMNTYIRRLFEIEDCIGIGNFRAEWETYGNDKILSVTVYTDQDYSFLKLKYSVV